MAIDCSRALLREIFDRSLPRAARPGDCFSGALFGTRDGQVIRIRAWRPGVRSERHQPLFAGLHGERDRIELLLQAASAGPAVQELAPLGMFLARRDGPLEPTASELEVFQALFPERWQVLLLIRSARSGGGARFFGRSPVPLSAEPVLSELSVSAPLPARRPPLWVLAVPAVAGWTLFAALAWLLWQRPDFISSVLHPRPALSLSLASRANGVELDWDPSSPAVRSALRANLSVNSEGNTRIIPLDAAALRGGAYLWDHPASDLQVTLTVYPGSGQPVTASARLISAPPPAAPATE